MIRRFDNIYTSWACWPQRIRSLQGRGAYRMCPKAGGRLPRRPRKSDIIIFRFLIFASYLQSPSRCAYYDAIWAFSRKTMTVGSARTSSRVSSSACGGPFLKTVFDRFQAERTVLNEPQSGDYAQNVVCFRVKDRRSHKELNRKRITRDRHS